MDLNYTKDKLIKDLKKGKNTLYFISDTKDRFMVFYIQSEDYLDMGVRIENKMFMLSPQVLNLLEFPRFARGYFQKGRTEGRYFIMKNLRHTSGKDSITYNNFCVFARDLSMFLYGTTDTIKYRTLHSYDLENKELDIL